MARIELQHAEYFERMTALKWVRYWTRSDHLLQGSPSGTNQGFPDRRDFVINDTLIMTVSGVHLNRDGIPHLLRQPLLGIRHLSGGPVSYAPVLKTPGPSKNSPFFCLRMEVVDAAVSLVSVDALETRTLCGLASWSLGPRP